MIERLGPAVCWALYLSFCRWAAPEMLPFLFWSFVVLLAMWVMWVGWLESTPETPKTEPHHSLLTGGQCYGVPKFLEYRKFQRDGQEIFEITRQCEACKMVFFEKKPK